MAHEESLKHSSSYESSDPFPARLPCSKKKRVECKAWITNFTMNNTTCPNEDTANHQPSQTINKSAARVSGRARGKVCLRRNDKHEVKVGQLAPLGGGVTTDHQGEDVCLFRTSACSASGSDFCCQHATLWCLHQDGDRKKGRSTTVKQPNGNPAGSAPDGNPLEQSRNFLLTSHFPPVIELNS
ncbi:unnamed protein product [Arctogadus glacialis]